MKNIIFVGAMIFAPMLQAASDPMGQTAVTFQSVQPDEVLQSVVENLKLVFDRYKVRVDSGTQIVSPLRIGGTQMSPTMKVTLRKCVFFSCETVALDAVISIEAVQGQCLQNYLIEVDLTRSSPTQTEYYQALNVHVCYRTKGNTARIDLTGEAVRSTTYSRGIVQKEILKILQLQIPAIGTALKAALTAVNDL